MNQNLQKYSIEPTSYEVKNYHNSESAFFNVFNNCCISREIQKGNLWESHLHQIFEKYITPQSIVIEAGAHIGTHSVKLSKLSQKLICFEPMKESYDLLLSNFNENKCNNVETYKAGLSDTISKTKFAWIPPFNLCGSGLHDNPMGVLDIQEWKPDENESYDVDLITIDSLNLENLDFIKLDVEGYEPKAIAGGINTISKYKPVITLECWANHKGDISIDYTKEQFKMLLDLGYEISNISASDFLFIPTK